MMGSMQAFMARKAEGQYPSPPPATKKGAKKKKVTRVSPKIVSAKKKSRKSAPMRFRSDFLSDTESEASSTVTEDSQATGDSQRPGIFNLSEMARSVETRQMLREAAAAIDLCEDGGGQEEVTVSDEDEDLTLSPFSPDFGQVGDVTISPKITAASKKLRKRLGLPID
jgi:hypothetical protein